MQGICAVCGQEVALERSFIPRQDERDRGFDDWEIDMTYGESINYLVITHEICEVLCEGSGQIPQTVIPRLQ